MFLDNALHIGPDWIGQFVTHKGTSHRIDDLQHEHFNGCCSYSDNYCSSSKKYDNFFQTVNKVAKVAVSLTNSTRQEIVLLQTDLQNAEQDFHDHHHDQAIAKIGGATTRILRNYIQMKISDAVRGEVTSSLKGIKL